MSSKSLVSLLLVLLILVISSFGFASCYTGEVDLSGTVNYVVDGDTFDIVTANNTEYRIRLADVNASENGQVGYVEAKNFRSSLIFNRTVYLDVDDLYTWDYSGTGNRLVCVVFVGYNSTHLLNVNEELVLAGHAELKDYENEFDPHSWRLYPSADIIPEFPLTIVPITALMGTLLLTVLIKRYNSKRIT